MSNANTNTLLLPALLCCAAAACGGAAGEQLEGEEQGPLSAADARQQEGLSATLTTDRSAYETGAPITMTIRVANESMEPVSFEFTSGQRYDFSVYDAEGNELWRWSAGRMFTAALGTETLQPGEALLYSATYEEGPSEPGLYRVEGVLTARDRRASASLVVRIE